MDLVGEVVGELTILDPRRHYWRCLLLLHLWSAHVGVCRVVKLQLKMCYKTNSQQRNVLVTEEEILASLTTKLYLHIQG